MDSPLDRIKAALDKKNNAANTQTTTSDPVVQQPAPVVTVVDISGTNNNNNNANNNSTNVMAQQTVQLASVQATAQAQASVGLAQTSIDKEVVDEQISKEEEHWVKAYWRPAMGWLYMLICFMDFVGFPAISMFLPVLYKGLGTQIAYTPWVSLTLSNGGLIHLAFGAILGVSAWTRGQEKMAKINSN
jgi:Holin of 3TMs, for gene-transfer release